jgi:uncharacterized membrane protein
MIGIAIFVLGLMGTVFFAISEVILPADISFSTSVTGFLTMILSRFMPRRTGLGREIYRRIRGYRLFIDRAESYKQQFFERKNIFTQVLPYTMVFGLTEKFAQQMKDIGLKPEQPTWYSGTQPFNAVSFASEMSGFSGSFSNAIASTPGGSGFSGGGGSGGGFGGGGGGSW